MSPPLMLFRWLIFLCVITTLHTNEVQDRAETAGEFLGATSKHLFYFVHITDIHIAAKAHTDRADDFAQFCNETIKTMIKPPVTIVSGDLVHNFNWRSITEHFEEDWKTYQNILLQTNVTQYTTWLDMRGNHDTFRDPDPARKTSFYRLYSHQGVNHTGSYQYTIKTKDNDSYSFVSIDMTRRPGPSLLFNFMGKINKVEMEKVRALSKETQKSNTTIFFGHYPLSFTYSSGIENVMRHGLAYLNGHVHAIVKHLYARHADGLLELELGDWKNNRQFRIVTIDGSLLSFNDVRFGKAIYAVISNPKAAKLKTPREHLSRLSRSTHIRLVIFHTWSIMGVSVSINGKHFGDAIQSNDNRNLYVLPWNASEYDDGHLHRISVEIKDDHGNVETCEHEFSLSTSVTKAWNRSNLVLYFHWPTVGMVGFSLLVFVYILLLLYHRYRARRMMAYCLGCFSLWNRIRLRMMVLCSVDPMFYSLVTLALYHLIGPWYIGHLTNGHLGVAFFWGTLMQGVYQLPDMQPTMGTIQFVFFVFPLTISLSSVCYYRYTQLQSNISLHESPSERCLRICTVYLVFAYALLFILLWSYFVSSALNFGFFLSPFGLLLPLLTLSLYIKSYHLNVFDFRLQAERLHSRPYLKDARHSDNGKRSGTKEIRESFLSHTLTGSSSN